MTIFQNVVRWFGVLCLIAGGGAFIGSFNSAYTARSFLEISSGLGEYATHYDIHKVLRALDLFMMGCTGLLVGGLCLGGLYVARRRSILNV